MIPGRVSWKYSFTGRNVNTATNFVTCRLQQATNRMSYQSLYSPAMGTKYTMFIVHIFNDPVSNMDIISTSLKNSQSEYLDNEIIHPNDYYCTFAFPYENDILSCSLTVHDNIQDNKFLFFDNIMVFDLNRFNMWCLPEGYFNFLPQPQEPIQLTSFDDLNQSMNLNNF